jgi:monoamine oxidase
VIPLPWTSPSRPLAPSRQLKRERDLRWQQPQCAAKSRQLGRVAVVGGGFAGLMAARQLARQGVKVTLYEARAEVGGRVLSNETFCPGRIVEEGAELIGSFHTRWLELARECGLSMISRMEPGLYERAGLDVRLSLDEMLSMRDFNRLTNAMNERVLKPLAELAEKKIEDPSRPWRKEEPFHADLKRFDGQSVQDALPEHCQISRHGTNPSDELLWKMIEFKLVNDEVAPLDEMNFLGLLCKVRAGQGERLVAERPKLDGYWEELEIFRCAEGCQTLAKKLAARIQDKREVSEPAAVRTLTAVTHIDLSKRGVTIRVRATRRNGSFVDDKPAFPIPGFSYVILAIPPSMWPRVTFTAPGKHGPERVDPTKDIGLMQMNDAIKFHTRLTERFWVTEQPSLRARGSAPYGGSRRIGQIWEGTDNQTRVPKQRVVLGVFAGPIHERKAPKEDDLKRELPRHYRGYASHLDGRNAQLYSDWPNAPFIKAGYWSPYRGEIFRVSEKLTRPYHDRLFFAGEHTQVDFFGYMEGALRSGERAAETLMLQACDLLDQPAAQPDRARPLLARTAPARAARASEDPAVAREPAVAADAVATGEVSAAAESPFLDRGVVAGEVGHDWAPRVAALVKQSAFDGALEDPERLDEDRIADEAMQDAVEAEYEQPWAAEATEEREQPAVHSLTSDITEAAFEETFENEDEGTGAGESYDNETGDDGSGEFEDEWLAAASEEEVPAWAAAIDPFPDAPTLMFDAHDERMRKSFEPVTVSTVTHLCSALVDLTTESATPPYAGLNDQEMIFAGSLPKICAMYAAFALQARVQAFVDAAKPNLATLTAPAIIQAIERAWRPKLRALFPKRPTKSFGNNQDIVFPRLDRIFDFSIDGKVDFQRAVPELTDEDLDRIGEFGTPQGLFHDWMRLFLRSSNNAAASRCILALGYFYLNGALARAGVFDATERRGLWLSADYAGHDWVQTAAQKKANAAGQPLAPRWAAAQKSPAGPRRLSHITATAASVARFLTLLAKNELLDADACHAMRKLMRADAGGLGSDANDALRRVGRNPVSVAAKFGRGDDGFDHECALVERDVGGKRLHYVAVGLGSPPKPKKHQDLRDQDLFDLFVLLDEAIVVRNA